MINPDFEFYTLQITFHISHIAYQPLPQAIGLTKFRILPEYSL